MKRVYFIRHAKSDWSDFLLDDFDRPLNKRGKKNAPLMGEYLKDENIYPDVFFSSPAKRAKKTSIKIANKLNFNKEKIKFKNKLYDANYNDILELILNVNDKHDTIFILGHNPSLNIIAYDLLGFDENIPTSGVLGLEFTCNSWVEINKENGKLLCFEYPKKLVNLV